MAEEEKRPEGQGPYVPATLEKRVLAWVGVAYMAMLVLLNLYPFYSGGRYLTGVGPLLVCPGIVGAAALCLLRLRREGCPMRRRCVLAALAALCAIVLLLALLDGVPALVAGLAEAAR